ncbi:MAG: kinase/pyrophosphorylase [Ahrensia sp.]|nr:kinase/pyrophosphorylase [Ahrensia sp.]
MRKWLRRARETVSRKTYFHLHLISDSTGETLVTAGRAAAAQYPAWRAIEHVTPMVRNERDLEKALMGVDETPGVVLYTFVNDKLAAIMEERCRKMGVPSHNMLAPVIETFEAFLGDRRSGRMGAQHEMDEDYFGRLEAIQFAMTHDDGNLPADVEQADIILIGISRTSKTPTSIHLAQRGMKTFNVPLVPGNDLPDAILTAKRPMVVALVASAERILQVRENRLLAYDMASDYEKKDDNYADKASILEELAWTRKLCQSNDWPMIDVSKRSVEETAAAILALYRRKPASAKADPMHVESRLDD